MSRSRSSQTSRGFSPPCLTDVSADFINASGLNRVFALGMVGLVLLAGCAAPDEGAKLHDGRPSSLAGAKGKSLYEMAVTNEAMRLRKENPALSKKESVRAARKNVSPEDYNPAESARERKAEAVDQARREFGAEFEKAMGK